MNLPLLKKNRPAGVFQWSRTRFFTPLALLLLAAVPTCCNAVVPIPDFLIYGTISIQGSAVTNNNSGTNIFVTAVRPSDGRVLASYQMGSTTNQGALFYALRVPMEDAPATSSQLAQPTDLLTITVSNQTAVQFQSNNIALNSGSALRLDFGPSIDTTGDGIPDGWKLGVMSVGDNDHDGISNYAEYIAGTDPNDPNDYFRLTLQNTNGQQQVTFRALLAQGIGYAGVTRYYGLQTTADVLHPTWQDVPGYNRIQASNQVVAYDVPPTASNAPALFRGRVWLEGSGDSVDSNDDGIPDDWEIAHVSAGAQGNNGVSDFVNYIAGTNPNDTNSAFTLSIQTLSNGVPQVSFPTLAAAGPGYEGRTRYYSLETTTNPSSGVWKTLPNYSRVPGTNQVIVFTSSLTTSNSPAYFRSRVWLETP